MKSIFRIFAFIALIGFVFTSCQKDNLLEEETQQEKGEWKEIVIEKTFPVTKTPFTRSLRTVYINDSWEQAQACMAMTVTDIPTGNKQEWLLIDAHSQSFFDFYLHPNETNTDDLLPDYGKDYGLYYTWANNFTQTTSWNGLVYEDASLTISINDFNIPTFADLNKLGSIIGSTSLIPRVLRMNYDGLWSNNSNYHFSTDIAAMWADSPGDPNIEPGCGVVCMWKISTNNVMTAGYTNMQNLGVNVRIVRDIQ